MPKDILLPEISENVKKALVVSILVKVGDTVEVDQPLMELETDKATFDVPSPEKGKIVEILTQENEDVEVGKPVVRIDVSNDAPVAKQEEKPAKPDTTEQSPAKEDKAPLQKPAAETPVQKVPEEKPVDKDSDPAALSKPLPAYVPVPTAPSVRRLAREIGLDINTVKGTGPMGRISKEDVKQHAKNILEEKTATPAVMAAGTPQRALPEFENWGPVRREQMSTIRRITAENVAYSWNTVPHVTQYDKVDITELEDFRKKYGKKVKAVGGKLTVTAIILKVLAKALQLFPKFNASIDIQKNEIIYKDYYNISIAVDTERGLLMPVIRDVDKKSITQLAVDLFEIAEKARSKKISPDDLEGGNFAVSNQGGIGGTNFTPIVFTPQVAILGISRSAVEPVFIDGEFYPRTILPLAMSYDHRIIDGADAARFIRWVREALENPILLAFE